MEWVAKLPEAHRCPALQFYIHNRAIRISNRKNVQIALMRSDISKEDLPTKDELMSDIHKRAELESKVLMFTSNVKDSDAFWQKENQELVGSSRYFEDPPGYRERTPQNILFFQTRAPPYNTHPAIHPLMPNLSEYFNFRMNNILRQGVRIL